MKPKLYTYDNLTELLEDYIDDPTIMVVFREIYESHKDDPRAPFVFAAWLYYHKLPFCRKIFTTKFWKLLASKKD